mmetsp:Transcript_3114/g.14043  ORF Transcript_3114/g.14043 Transcript_3114/m.14043 type:complete len:221 (+) Transcript_3114:591-1253(+)
MSRSADARRVDASAARLLVGPVHSLGARADPLVVPRVRLVREAVVVLDDVDAALGELVRHPRELRGGAAHRLERRHEHHRAVGDPSQFAQTLDAKLGTRVVAEHAGGHANVRDHHALLHARVSKDDVHQLRHLATRGVGVVTDLAPPRPAQPFAFRQGFELTHDVLADPASLGHQRRRQLHRLLQADGQDLIPGVLLVRSNYIVDDCESIGRSRERDVRG